MYRTLLIFWGLFLLQSPLQAQVFQWANALNSPSFHSVNDMAVDTAGNSYLVGSFETSLSYTALSGSGTLVSLGDYDGFIAKYDPAGNLTWIYNWGGPDEDIAVTVAVDNDQQIFVSGYVRGSVDLDPGPGVTTVNPGNGATEYLVKLDPQGNLIWHLQQNVAPGNVDGLATDQLGNVFAVGKFRNQLDINPDPNVTQLLTPSLNKEGLFIQKFSPNGNLIWAFNNEADNFPRTNIKSDLNGGVYLFGTYQEEITLSSVQGPGIPIPAANNFINSFVQKLDPGGNPEWEFVLKGVENVRLEDASRDLWGNTYCIGVFSDQMDLDPGSGIVMTDSLQPRGMFLIKVNPNGNFDWGRTLNSPGIVNGNSVSVDEQGYVYSCGNYADSVDWNPGPLPYWIEPVPSLALFVQVLDQYGGFVNAFSSQGTGSNSAVASILKSEYITGKGLFLSGQNDLDTDLDPDSGVVTLPGGNNLTRYLMLWQPSLGFDQFEVVIDAFQHPNCLDSGFVSWFPFNGTPPFEYFWEGQSIGQDTFVRFKDTAPKTLGAVDVNGLTFSRQYLPLGPSDFSGLDLRADLITSPLRPGVPGIVFLTASNQGCLPASGELFFVPGPALNFVSSTPPPDRTSGNSLFWNIQNLTYDSGGIAIPVTLLPDTSATQGQIVCMEIGITVVDGDLSTTNNYQQYCQALVNSYDPNDIQVFPQGDCDAGYVLMDQKLTYKIRFQNTGNAPAINVAIRDTLAPVMDIRTLRIVGQSHPDLVTEVGPGNLIQFKFDNIWLPDSTSDEAGSQGFVIYEVDPHADIPIGSRSSNRAGIYFDFNPPIITNTVNNLFVEEIPFCGPAYFEGEGLEPLSLFPNPSDGNINLVWLGLEPFEGELEVRIYSTLGQLVYSTASTFSRVTDFHPNLANGMYFLYATDGESKKSFRVLVRQ